MRIVLVLVLVLVLDLSARAEPTYKLDVPERISLVAGTSGALAVELAVAPGFTVSKDAPIIVDLAPDAALAVKHKRLGRADAVDPDAAAPRFQIAVRSATAGDFAIKLHVRFWVCGKKVCTPIDARRSVAVAVTTPAP